MRMKDKRVTLEKYCKLKRKLYTIYLKDKENPDGRYVDRMHDAVAPYVAVIPSLGEIVNDTIKFPFDKELSDFIERNKSMNLDDLIVTSANVFKIDTELVISKIREYTAYGFHELLNEGVFNNETVGRLSKLYAERNTENPQK